MSALRPPDRRSGTYAVVFGAVVVAVCIVVLSFLTVLSPAVAIPLVVVDVLLLAGMVLARLLIRPVVRRQWTITICLLAACVLSLGGVVLIISMQRA